MLTIGQLARYLGVSTKTIRVYHEKGLLPEPDRDASGYRRYTARDAIELIKIRTLAEAGVPLARIRTLHTAPEASFREALTEIDADLTTRIQGLRDTQQRLRDLSAGRTRLLPDDVETHLRHLGSLGFSARWIAMETDAPDRSPAPADLPRLRPGPRPRPRRPASDRSRPSHRRRDQAALRHHR